MLESHGNHILQTEYVCLHFFKKSQADSFCECVWSVSSVLIFLILIGDKYVIPFYIALSRDREKYQGF